MALIGYNTSSGLWFVSNKNYVGIKYEDGDIYRFGWICLDFVYKEVRVYNHAIEKI